MKCVYQNTLIFTGAIKIESFIIVYERIIFFECLVISKSPSQHPIRLVKSFPSYLYVDIISDITNEYTYEN